MNISERINEIKLMMRKKITDDKLEICVNKLLQLETEIRRHVKKGVIDSNYKLQFTSGDLRIIATCINTKMTKFQKRIYYENIDNTFKKLNRITDEEYTQVITQTIKDYKLYRKLLDCHFLLGSITSTTNIIEKMREQ